LVGVTPKIGASRKITCTSVKTTITCGVSENNVSPRGFSTTFANKISHRGTRMTMTLRRATITLDGESCLIKVASKIGTDFLVADARNATIDKFKNQTITFTIDSDWFARNRSTALTTFSFLHISLFAFSTETVIERNRCRITPTDRVTSNTIVTFVTVKSATVSDGTVTDVAKCFTWKCNKIKINTTSRAAFTFMNKSGKVIRTDHSRAIRARTVTIAIRNLEHCAVGNLGCHATTFRCRNSSIIHTRGTRTFVNKIRAPNW
jgi:hypothetical protein